MDARENAELHSESMRELGGGAWRDGLGRVRVWGASLSLIHTIQDQAKRISSRWEVGEDPSFIVSSWASSFRH